MRNRAERLTLAMMAAGTIIVWTMALLYALVLTGHTGFRAVPRCEEDAVLVGTGQFEDGRWSAYTCGPAAGDLR